MIREGSALRILHNYSVSGGDRKELSFSFSYKFPDHFTLLTLMECKRWHFAFTFKKVMTSWLRLINALIISFLPPVNFFYILLSLQFHPNSCKNMTRNLGNQSLFFASLNLESCFSNNLLIRLYRVVFLSSWSCLRRREFLHDTWFAPSLVLFILCCELSN